MYHAVDDGLSEGEIRFYQDQGYLVMPQILDADRVARLRELVEAELHRVKTAPIPGQWDVLEKRNDGSPAAVRRLSRVMSRHAAFKEVALDPKVVGAVHSLIGADAMLCVNRHNMMMVKAPRVGDPVPWHQDGAIWGNPEILSFMVFLDAADLGNGCLQIIPGGHRWGRLGAPAGQESWRIDLESPEQDAWVRQALPVCMKAGDGLFFHAALPHFSGANRSEHGRRNFIFAYVSPAERWRCAPTAEPIDCLPMDNKAVGGAVLVK